MKIRVLQSFYIIVMFAVTFILPATSLAQEPEDPCPIPLEACPIDTNLYFLFAAAIIIAAKKTYDYKKRQVNI